MSNYRDLLVAGLISSLMLSALLAVQLLAATGSRDQPSVGFECVTGGERPTTIHAGLREVNHNGTGVWYLLYVEGNKRVYIQRPGEACGVVDDYAAEETR